MTNKEGIPTCQTDYTWQNSSQTLTAKPSKFCKANNKEELIQIVQTAVDKGQKIRITGGRHSWYPLVLTDRSVEGGSLSGETFCLIDVSNMTTITKETISEGNYLVHVEPGATMGDLQAATIGKDWPTNPAPKPWVVLSTNGVIPTELQIGGFVGAGCHGTGWEQPTVPDIVYAVDMILIDENKKVYTRTFSEANPDDPMEVVRVNLGTIGIMTKITFKAEPLFCVHGVDTVDTLMSDLITPVSPPAALNYPDDLYHPTTNHPDVTPNTNFKELVENTDYLELFWFPFNTSTTDISLKLLPKLSDTKVWIKKGNKIKKEGASTPNCPSGVPSQVWDGLEKKFGGLAYSKIAEYSSGGLLQQATVEGLLKIMSTLAYSSAKDDYVAPAPRFYHYQTSAFPVLDFSFAIPMDLQKDPNYLNFSKAWWSVVYAVNQWAHTKSEFNQRYPVNVALHARFIKNSQSLLSPAYQPAGSSTHTCWIEFISGAPTPNQADKDWYKNYMKTWAEFCQLIGPIWLELGGRPHWAKQWQLLDKLSPSIYQQLPKMYGDNLTKFKAVRDQLDPTETFLYSWTEKIFNPEK